MAVRDSNDLITELKQSTPFDSFGSLLCFRTCYEKGKAIGVAEAIAIS